MKKKLLFTIFIVTCLVTTAEEVSLLYPASGATDIPYRGDFFMWDHIEVSSGLTVSYDFYLGTDPDPPCLESGLYSGWRVTDGSTFIAEAYTLDYNSETYFLFYDNNLILDRASVYYWKVVAKVSDGSEINSQVYSFTTNNGSVNPSKPVITYPANNASNIESSGLTITWTASTDVDNDPVTYNVYLGTHSDNLSLEAGSLTGLQYTIPYTLADQQQYYLTVTAVDGYNGTEVANTNAPFSFTVENYLNDAPDTVLLNSPANNAVNTTCDVTLSWSKPDDKDGDILYYDVYFDNNLEPATLIASNITARAQPVEIEKRYDTYYWKVVARDNNGGEAQSAVYSFTPWNKPDEFIEMVKIEGGTYNMAYNNQPVTLDDFLIGKYEVTWAQFCNFLNSMKASVFVNQTIETESDCYVVQTSGTGYLGGSKVICLISDSKEIVDYEDPKIYYANGSYQVKTGYENYPAEDIAYNGAKYFCKWAGGRLPSDAEWEFAARGGNQSNGYTYSGSNTIDDVAWYYDNANNPHNPMVYPHLNCTSCGNGTFEVGQKEPNELGLYDMSGNVTELVSDWYNSDYFTNTPTDEPFEEVPDDDPTFDYRGGSYFHYYDKCQSDSRNPVQYCDEYVMKDFRGFRFAAYAEDNDAPTKAGLISPADNSSGITTSVEFKWHAFSDPDDDLIAYDVYVGKTSDPTELAIGNVQDTTCIFSELEDHTTYYWKVVAKDNRGNATESDVWAFSTSAITTYTLSGTVLSEFGTPVADVELIGFDEEVITDKNGTFSVEVTAGWTNTIRPFKFDYVFSPETIEINQVQQDVSGIAITAYYTYHYDVVIYITDGNGNYMTNAEMRTGNGTISPSTYTWYLKEVEAGWSATIEPVLKGYDFSPATYEINALEEDITLYFTASSVNTYTISGNVSDDAGNPLSGVTLSGFTDNVTTDANGNYSTTENAGWNGTVVSQLDGYVFSPEKVSITSLHSNITQDFIATESTEDLYSITFTFTCEGSLVTNTAITVNSTVYTSDENGQVTVNTLPGGTHSFAITASGYQETSLSVYVPGSNTTCDVSLTKSTYSITFSVTDGTYAISGAVILFDGSSYFTDSNGETTVSNLTNGSYDYSVSITGYAVATGTIEINNSDVKKNFTLIATGTKTIVINEIVVYPNPAHEQITIEIDDNTGIDRIEILTVRGIKVFEKEYNAENSVSVNTTMLSEGIYFIRVTDRNAAINLKKIIKK